MVGGRDRVELVRDDDEGRVAPQGCHGVGDARFVIGIEGARGLIEQDNGRRLQERTGDGDALAFPSGQSTAGLADRGIPAEGKASNDLINTAQSGRVLHLRGARVGAADSDVSFEGVVKEVNVLEDEGQLCHQLTGIPVAHVPPTNGDDSPVNVIESCDKARDGGLATA